MLRWVFIHPQNVSSYYDPEVQEPLGIGMLAALRKACGDQVLLLDSCLDRLSDLQLARRAASFRPDVMAFSVMTAQQLESVTAIHAEACRILGLRPVHWLAGGNFPTTEPKAAARLLPSAFTVVRFEGENALSALAGLWNQEGASGEAGALRMLAGEPVADLDTLEFAERRHLPSVLANGWAVNIQGSRGCCGVCSYCSSPGARHGAPWRGRSANHVAQELEQLYRLAGADTFNFVDEDFLGPPAGACGRARTLADELCRRRLPISLGVQVRPTVLSVEVASHLQRAGVAYVFVGIESDCPADLARWRRPPLPDPWRLLNDLQGYGFEVGVGAIPFHPHATLEGIRRFATGLHALGLLDHRTATNRMDAIPGAALYCQGLADGLLDPMITGPQALPFHHPEVGTLHDELVQALAPIGPPSMHAACALPPLTTRRRLSRECQDAHRCLKAIIADLNVAVHNTLLTLLDTRLLGHPSASLAGELMQHNLMVAIAASERLAKGGFLPSLADMRQAIHHESGL